MTSITLWKNRENNELDPKLFSVTSDNLAKQIGADGESQKGKNKGTQLRRFFDEILRLDTEARNEQNNWVLILPRVHMVLAKVAYAEGRGLVTKSFVDLMRNGINQVEEKRDLHAFTAFFETFMGFYKMYRPN